MKLSVFVCLLMAGILISGCASHKKKTSASVPKATASVPKASKPIAKASKPVVKASKPVAKASKPVVKASASVPKDSSMIITPDGSLAAKVVRYNSTGRFVVLSFPVGQMPGMGQSLFLYHNGLKAGEVKITGPQRDSNVVADLVTGNAQVGDEVRDQ
ncbi:MAG TPA: hypothetical protein VF480_02585 [Verrucomicrobiae bacterium]